MELSNMALIGNGAQADVYLFENKAIKVFKHEHLQANACHEAELQNKARKAGLPVPAILEVIELDGRTAIVMEYIEGTPLGSMMLEDMENAHYYLAIAADMQMSVHSITADGFPHQNDKLKNNICNTPILEAAQKQKLLQLLQNMGTDHRLCHGDFHVFNLIQTTRNIKIIDWVDASSGSISADVCRSYLLYLLYRSEIAEVYLEMYCHKANMLKQDVLRWLPVIAGARLNENVSKQDIPMLLRMVDA